MTVASFIASQRAEFQVPHVISCQALEVSESWFYKWKDRPPTPRQRRRRQLDEAVKRSFEDSESTYGSPRVYEAPDRFRDSSAFADCARHLHLHSQQ